MTTISLKLPRPLLRELEAEAASQGVSKSEVVRACLEQGLARRRRRKARPSCLDLVDDLAGSFEGPADLSSNPRYLDEALAADARRGRKNHR
jgi:Arc/MetJ-type ribon-helix-helix transcriptional regulator